MDNDGTGLEIAPSVQNLKDQHTAPLDAANNDMAYDLRGRPIRTTKGESRFYR